jgi:hypothetical protein
MYGPEFIEPGAAPKPASLPNDATPRRRKAWAVYIDKEGRRRWVSGYGPTQANADARVASRVASIKEDRDALNDAFETLHTSIVRNAAATAPNRADPDFGTWLAGYSEGVEHALETLTGGGDKARAFLATLHTDGTEA